MHFEQHLTLFSIISKFFSSATGTLTSRAAKRGNPFPCAPWMGGPPNPLRRGQAPSYSLWCLRHQINRLQIWCLRHQAPKKKPYIYTYIFWLKRYTKYTCVYIHKKNIHVYTYIVYLKEKILNGRLVLCRFWYKKIKF